MILSHQVSEKFGVKFNPGNWTLATFRSDVTSCCSSRSQSRPNGSWASYHDASESTANGTLIHLFTRDKKADIAFEYRGMVRPIDHEGSRPMSVRFRLDL